MKRIGYLLLAVFLVAGMTLIATAAEEGGDMMKAPDEMMMEGKDMMKDEEMMVEGMMKGEAMMEEGGKMMKEGEAMEKEMAEAVVAIEGYCPVSITKGKFIKGSPEFIVEHEGKTYYFVSEELRQHFIVDRGQFLHALEDKFMKLKEEAMKEEAMKSGGEMMKGSDKGSTMKGSY